MAISIISLKHRDGIYVFFFVETFVQSEIRIFFWGGRGDGENVCREPGELEQVVSSREACIRRLLNRSKYILQN